MKATFKRIKYGWGVMVTGGKPSCGDWVEATTKDGDMFDVRIKAVLKQTRRGVICAIMPEERVVLALK